MHVITWQDNGLPKESLEEGFHVHRIRAPRLKFVGRSLYVLKELLLIKHSLLIREFVGRRRVDFPLYLTLFYVGRASEPIRM